MDPHIIIGGENIQLIMKRERPTLYKESLQFGQLKCSADDTGSFAKTAQSLCRSKHLRGEASASTARNSVRQETRKYVENT